MTIDRIMEKKQPHCDFLLQDGQKYDTIRTRGDENEIGYEDGPDAGRNAG
jgi:hypothetical protein